MTQTLTIQTLYDEFKVFEKNLERKMVTKVEMESFFETFEIMSNSKTMKSIKQSLKELDSGKGLGPINKVADLL